MNTITIEATRKNGSNGNGDQYVSDTPDGYALSSVQTVSNSASYLLVLHTYTKKVTSDSNPSEAEIAERVRLLVRASEVPVPPSADDHGLGHNGYLCSCDGSYWHNRDSVDGFRWTEIGETEFGELLERVAIRQLLAERAK